MYNELFRGQFFILLIVLYVACSASHNKLDNNTSDKNTEKIQKKNNTNIQYRKPILKYLFYNTTLSETLKPVLPAKKPKDPLNIPMNDEKKYGLFEKGKGEPHITRDDIKINQDNNQRVKELSLIFFSHITDVHISDEEAPCRATLAEAVPFASDGYRPQQDLTLQVFDATLRTINEINKISPIDFIINTGDIIDSGLFNELRWFIDTMDGKKINPDSGDDDDPKAGPLNDSSDEFQAAGTNIPWYVTTGNHNIVKGLIAPAKLKTFNDIIAGMIDPIELPDSMKIDFRLFYIDDPLGEYSSAVINPLSPDTSFSELNSRVSGLTGGKIAKDSNRKFVNRKEFIHEFFNSTSTPAGHGFSKENLDSGIANYSFLPKEGIPIRVIALDTLNYEGGWADGDISLKQINNFLIPELKKAKKNKELVIVTSHHHPGAIQKKFDIKRLIGKDVPKGNTEEESKDFKSVSDSRDAFMRNYFNIEKYYNNGKTAKDPIGELIALFTHSEDAIDGDQLRELLLSYPNVFLYLAGHSHVNRVTFYGRKGIGSGFWQVLTSSLIDYPQQTRLLEVVYDGEGIGSIYSTMVDFKAKDGSLPYLSRSISLADVQYGKVNNDRAGNKEDRNVILKFKIPKEISELFDKYRINQ